MKDHKKQEVIQLAESIYIRQIDTEQRWTEEKLKSTANASLVAAMAFREAEDEVFGNNE